MNTTEQAEEAARQALAKHVRECPVCSQEPDNYRSPCREFGLLAQQWGHSLMMRDQARKARAGCGGG